MVSGAEVTPLGYAPASGAGSGVSTPVSTLRFVSLRSLNDRWGAFRTLSEERSDETKRRRRPGAFRTLSEERSDETKRRSRL